MPRSSAMPRRSPPPRARSRSSVAAAARRAADRPAPPARAPPRADADARARRLGRASTRRTARPTGDCAAVTGRVLYVEAVDPDGDGDAHYVLAGGRVTAPGRERRRRGARAAAAPPAARRRAGQRRRAGLHRLARPAADRGGRAPPPAALSGRRGRGRQRSPAPTAIRPVRPRSPVARGSSRTSRANDWAAAR